MVEMKAVYLVAYLAVQWDSLALKMAVLMDLPMVEKMAELMDPPMVGRMVEKTAA